MYRPIKRLAIWCCLRFATVSTSSTAWAFHAGYFLTNGSDNSALYAITTPSGDPVTASPKTAGYNLEVDRQITQNIQVMAQYRGFFEFNGVSRNIDGMGRNASDNNTLWLSVFFAF
jgi:hypothetical protein